VSLTFTRAGVFDRRWITLALLLIPLGVVLEAPALLVLSAFILTLFPVAGWWNRRALRGVTYERWLSHTRAFPGETIGLTVQIANGKLLPVPWLRIQDEFPQAVRPIEVESGESLLAPSHEPERGFLVSLLALRWYERVRRRYTLRCYQRGVYPLGPVRYTSGDLFSLFQSERSESSTQRVIVYPRVLPLRELGVPAKAPFGDTRAPRQLFQDPSRIMGCRDHQPRDSFRHIHWKATARRGDLQVKIYEPTISLCAVICLNVATFAHPWQGMRPELLEHAIVVAASLANYAVELKYTVGLVANGAMPHADQPLKVLPGRSPDQLARILEVLAGVTPFATASIERLLRDESPNLPWGATLVVVTAVVTDELRATLARLREAGRRLVLIGVDYEPPAPPPGILCHHAPPPRGGSALASRPVGFRPPSREAGPSDNGLEASSRRQARSKETVPLIPTDPLRERQDERGAGQ
jgi:uncharacterized protein (DUF58 family)